MKRRGGGSRGKTSRGEDPLRRRSRQRKSSSGSRNRVCTSVRAPRRATIDSPTTLARVRGRERAIQNNAQRKTEWRLAALPSTSRGASGASTVSDAIAMRAGIQSMRPRVATNTVAASTPATMHEPAVMPRAHPETGTRLSTTLAIMRGTV